MLRNPGSIVLLVSLGVSVAAGCSSSDSAPQSLQDASAGSGGSAGKPSDDAAVEESGQGGAAGGQDAAMDPQAEVAPDALAQDADEHEGAATDGEADDAQVDADDAQVDADDAQVDADDSGGDGFWNHPYDPAGSPSVANGHHNATLDCMGCHDGAGSAPKFLFGGTIFDALGKTPVEHAEVGVKDPGGLHSSYSASNGNFWVAAAADSIDWSQVEIRARDAYGEMTMPVQAAAGCNACHKGPSVIKAF
ncbi:MAG: hypothetical protein HY898_23690 [Deltaproteobacteria bacterium]|nr:hypothetical protein [Deltaproteobacteria bacterium]